MKNDENDDDVMRLLNRTIEKYVELRRRKSSARKASKLSTTKRLPTTQTKRRSHWEENKRDPVKPKKTPSNEEDLMALLQQHNKKFKSKRPRE